MILFSTWPPIPRASYVYVSGWHWRPGGDAISHTDCRYLLIVCVCAYYYLAKLKLFFLKKADGWLQYWSVSGATQAGPRAGGAAAVGLSESESEEAAAAGASMVDPSIGSHAWPPLLAGCQGVATADPRRQAH